MALVGRNSRLLLQRILQNRSAILPRQCPLTTSSLRTARSEGEITEFVRKIEAKHWRSYGYDSENQANDRFLANYFGFICCFVFSYGIFVMYYLPDYRYRDWAMREAYIVLNQRERDGLPLIDKNFVDPAKLELPSDEELGDTEIYI